MCGRPFGQNILKQWAQEEKSSFFARMKCFPHRTVTSATPIGFSRAMNLFLLLNRFAFMFLANIIMLLPLLCSLSVFPFSCVSPSQSQRTCISRINQFLETGWLFPSPDVKRQVRSHHEVRGGCRWLTQTAVGCDLSELTGIFHVEKFYANISLVIMDVLLNTSSSSQISATSYLNIYFRSILSATALLRLHTGSLLNSVQIKAFL